MNVAIIERRIIGRDRRNRLTISLGEGTSQQVPLPSLADLGLVRELRFLNILDQSGESYWHYDNGSQSLRLIGPGPGAQLIHAEAVGW